MNVIFNNEVIDVRDLKIKYAAYSTFVADDVVFGENVKIGKGCTISNGCIIKDNVVIDDEVKIGSNTIIGSNCIIESGVKIGSNVVISDNQIIGDGAKIKDNTILENTFYMKTSKSNITYCGNNKASIGCQLFPLDFWFDNYKDIATKFDYTDDEIQECLNHLNYIKDNI